MFNIVAILSISHSAARLDLALISDLRDLKEYREAIATATLKVMDRHSQYLG